MSLISRSTSTWSGGPDEYGDEIPHDIDVLNNYNEDTFTQFTDSRGKTIQVREITDPQDFITLLQENTKNISEDKKWRVSVPQTPEDIQDWIKDHPGVKMYITSNGTTGAVTPDGDMISLSSHAHEGAQMFEYQIQNGGRKLDTFDGNYGLYRKLGFVPVSYTPFNAEIAKNDGWKPEYGSEDVVFMVYGGNESKSIKNKSQLKTELKEWKKRTTPQTDTPGSEEYEDSGYAKAEQQRNRLLNTYGNDFQKIWNKEGLR